MERDTVGTGDERFEDDSNRPPLEEETLSPEESLYHHEHSEADIPEIRSTQLIPGPLDEHAEPGMQPQILKFHQPTRHNSK